MSKATDFPRYALIAPDERRLLRRRARRRGDTEVLGRLWGQRENDGYARFRRAARAMYDDEGTLEIDDGAVVSANEEGGAYVMAWVYVSREDLAAIEVLPRHQFPWTWMETG